MSTNAQYINFHETVTTQDGDEVLFSCNWNTGPLVPNIGNLVIDVDKQSIGEQVSKIY